MAALPFDDPLHSLKPRGKLGLIVLHHVGSRADRCQRDTESMRESGQKYVLAAIRFPRSVISAGRQ